MDNRKELQEQYKNRKVTGGVFRVVNTKNGRYYLAGSDDLHGDRSMFEFAVKTGSCMKPYPGMQRDWKEFGSAAFVFEVLEEQEKKPEEERNAFLEDMRTLAVLWAEKFDAELSYNMTK